MRSKCTDQTTTGQGIARKFIAGLSRIRHEIQSKMGIARKLIAGPASIQSH